MKIDWPERVRNEAVLQSVKEETNILHVIKRRKDNWVGHILRRSGFLKHITERNIGGMNMTGRQRRRSKQLLHDLKEWRGSWKLKEKALDRAVRRTR